MDVVALEGIYTIADCAKFQNLYFRTLEKKIKDTSLVHVYFKNLGVTKYTKDRLFGWADLICRFTYNFFHQNLFFYS